MLSKYNTVLFRMQALSCDTVKQDGSDKPLPFPGVSEE